MIRRTWYFLFDWFFYLPGVAAPMSGMTRAQQNAARLFVWRRLFRSVRYWLLTLLLMGATTVGMLLVLPWIRQTFVATGGDFSWRLLRGLLVLVLGTAVTLVIAVVGMEPLRTMVRRAFDEYLASAGLQICRQCGYDLREKAADRCPECGTNVA